MENDKGSADTSAGQAAGAAIAVGATATATTIAVSGGIEQGLGSQPIGGSVAEFENSLGFSVLPPENVSLSQASRFLGQATCGANRQDIEHLASIGYNAWLNEQFAMPRGRSHWRWMKSRNIEDDPRHAINGRGKRFWDASIWRQLIASHDQLRQRVALALLDTMVVGIEGLSERWPQFAMAAYMDLLLDNAFGNYRDLIGAITKSSAMAQYLTYLSSSREDGSGTMPDENYARELMQLFTIGLHQLKQNGELRLGKDEPLPAFTQDDVTQLAKIFTGLRLQSNDLSTPDVHRRPLVIDPRANETGDVYFLRHKISGGGMEAVDAALDVLFMHPNTPPFFARTLIRRLVSSNPSRHYINRVAATFIDDGTGQRGDMKAVIKAVLTDPEARSEGALTAPHTGKVRDPILRLTNWARAFGARSRNGTWYIGNLSSPDRGLGQSPGRSPSVFHFFRPGFSPPQSELSRRGLVAPELQIANEQSVISYINFMAITIRKGAARGDIKANYSYLLGLSTNAAALLNEVDLILAGGQLSSERRKLIAGALNNMRDDDLRTKLNRVRAAILLTMVSPDYLVLK